MKKADTEITEQQIQLALRQFKLVGGKIHHIPDQVTPRVSLVRSRAESLAGWVAAMPTSPEPVLPATE